MSHERIYRLFSLWIGLLGRAVPRSRRDRWVEEWQGEIWHALGPHAPVGIAAVRHVLRRSFGAVRDALVTRRATDSTVRLQSKSVTRYLESIRSDVRFAWRGLRKQSGFAAVAIVTLAFGIGINTAMFSMIRSVLVSPLPFEDAQDLVMVWERRPSQGRERNVASYPDFVDWRDQNQVFQTMAAYRGRPANLSTTGKPEPIRSTDVTHDFFNVLRVSPLLGRGFIPAEDRPGGDPVAVISHTLWRDRFGSRPDALGQIVTINSVPRTVVGVLPPSFDFPFGTSVWALLATDTAQWSRGSHGIQVIARLIAGVDLDRARADMAVIANRLEEAYPGPNTGHYNAVYGISCSLRL